MKKLFTLFASALSVVLAAAPLTEENKLTTLPNLKWASAVAIPSKGKMVTPEKGKSICFTYPIIYDESGKPKGTSWPRCNISLPQKLRNWSRYDYLEFNIYTTFNRSDEEYLPVTIGIGGVKTRTLVSFGLKNLRQNI
ncbi:MAG: hypothetical protein J6S54_11255 [Lentisphaeria bacterium]|nr:hypothetical protein [Lentisphaeria bacterium]